MGSEFRRWTNVFIAIAALLVLAGVLAPACIWLAAEAIIERRYPLASTTAHAQMTEKEITRGAHLMQIAGCADCHGADLEGRHLQSHAVLPLTSANLLRVERTMSDDDLERAIRYGIKPDATTQWGMPSGSYKYMSEADVAAIISYLRSLPPNGGTQHPPRFNYAARWALLRGDIKPAVLEALDSESSLDLGPRYDGGRYLARLTCGECHGTDFKGAGYAPDLNAVAFYSRPSFFELLRRGFGVRARLLPVMHRIAPLRFRAFADYEIVALYDYLQARAHAPATLIAKDEALRRHEESAKALNDSQQ